MIWFGSYEVDMSLYLSARKDEFVVNGNWFDKLFELR